ncbi:MAG: hypothetical protein M3464_15715 [Chloroflexota bacterium]|nr:hypothetical protein [Chloroflexota bacterium]
MESVTHLLWGLVLIAAGVFLIVYGGAYFRYALAAIGFGVGFLGSIGFTIEQDLLVRFLIAIAAGIIGAALLYFLVDFSFIIGGAIFGLVVALLLIGLLEIVGLDVPAVLVTILALIGLAAGAFFGKDLGQVIVLLATAAAGAYLIVSGVHVMYESRIGGDGMEPLDHLAQRFGLVLFLILFALGYLMQSVMHGRRPLTRAR